ncbi:hypothetical protein ACGFYV_07700 [Streptomyces sp. NPDC048297]|uniref:hypothetical protein n=1 Tax=Streptomyces sp. NPDC048297 TaxID=3365531 RepID=UPI003720B984
MKKLDAIGITENKTPNANQLTIFTVVTFHWGWAVAPVAEGAGVGGEAPPALLPDVPVEGVDIIPRSVLD